MSSARRRRRRLGLAGAVALLWAPTAAVAAEPGVSILPLPFAVEQFRGPASRVSDTVASTEPYRASRTRLAEPHVVVWGRGGGAAIVLTKGDLQIVPADRGAADMSALERGRGEGPATRTAAVGGLTVTLEGASDRYPHEALGGRSHPTTLVVRERRPAPPSSEPRPVAIATERIEAGSVAVWEDREPRIVDLDGDGSPEILTIRSYGDRGSALVVIGRRDGRWQVVAETPADGQPMRWLNPAATLPAAAEKAGLVALVRRPHRDGVLQLWSFEGSQLVLVGERAGFANHAFGEAAQDLAAVLPGAGGRRLALPTVARDAVAIVTLDGTLRELARIPLPGQASTGLAVLGSGPDHRILVGLEDGRVAAIRP